jgi:hypothetical protein
VDGGISSIADLEAAENALQLLMWHDRVDVMIPAFKYRKEGLVSYARCEGPRPALAFSLFSSCQPHDVIYAIEEVTIRDGQVTTSSLSDSCILGQRFRDAIASYAAVPAQLEALAAIPIHMGVPAYLSDPNIQGFVGKRGFFGDFYETIRRDWKESTAVIPDTESSVELPPLISVVLDRAVSRSQIPDASKVLREEVGPAREEMHLLPRMLHGPYSQQEVEDHCREVKASFGAVIPAARKHDVSFRFPLLRLFTGASPLETVIKRLKPDYVPKDPRVLANRTVTGRTFTKLFASRSVQSLVSRFMSPAEIRSVEAAHHSRREHGSERSEEPVSHERGTSKGTPLEYDVALSFAGEDRHHAKALADELCARDVRVFYDEEEQADLWGKDLYQHLQRVYRDTARYCVVFVSASYARKQWPRHELKQAQARAFREESEYILPLRLDDTDLPGVNATVGYVDLRSNSVQKVRDLILRKLAADT